MANQWTKQQLKAIEARYTALIVSAAAGSGKTSVLVERLTRLLVSTDPKIPAERMIVVTFTNDAAAEMKQRLTSSLSRQLEQEPDNSWLAEQQAALQTAKISTIHSFCFDLIRENVQSLEISTGFRIMDDTEEKVMVSKAVEAVFERFYLEEPECITLLVDFFCSKSDRQLEGILLQLYEFVLSIPFYGDWLDEQERKMTGNPEGSSWEDQYFSFLREKLADCSREAEAASAMARSIQADKAQALLEKEAGQFTALAEGLSDSSLSWNGKISALSSIAFGRISFPRNPSDSPEAAVAEEIKKIRERYRKTWRTVSGNLLFTREEAAEDLAVHHTVFQALRKLLSALLDEIWSRKTEKNAIGFSDAEQLAIRLLARKTEGVVEKTELAEELSQYYEVIMIDEYQDANDTQDLIFKLLSRHGTAEKAGENLFVVGDIKQSIYRFRQANPRIFIGKLADADPYTEDYQGKNAAVLLNQNFRSSHEVVSFVNFLFSQLMSESVGEVAYTERESLVQGAAYDSGTPREPEILLIPSEDIEESETDSAESVNQEARYVAAKIHEMLQNGHPVYEKGQLRPCRSKDFCILLRNKISGVLYVQELEKYGIKAHTDDVEGYLKSREISVLMNLLQVVDNPLRDIPMASVLLSPMFMLTAGEAAKIRLICPKGHFYHAMCTALGKTYGEELGGVSPNESESYYPKLKKFDTVLSQLRRKAAGDSLEALIRGIYDSTDFLSVVQVYKDGEQKKANLRLLLEYAKNYEKSMNGGLSGFIRYMNSVSSQGGDLKRAGIVSAADDVVSVKTIHRSKGLEYPFVFLCRTSTRFNQRDLSAPMQLHLEDGIGFRIQDKKTLRKYISFPYLAIREQNRKNMLSEDLRLLYVALTRAREKLFLTLDWNDRAKDTLSSFARELASSGEVTSRLASKALCMQDWLMMGLLRHPDSVLLRRLSGSGLELETGGLVLESDFPLSLEDGTEKPCPERKQSAPKSARPDPDLLRQLEKRVSFSYHSRLSQIPAKLTVSEIVRREEGVEGAGSFQRPHFILEGKSLTGAEKGTATHSFLQYADYQAAARDPEKERNRLVSYGILTQKEGEAVDIGRVQTFFHSPLYRRMEKAKNLWREKKFLMRIQDIPFSGALAEQYHGTEGMIQGIADCIFEEESGLVLLDYKTDYAKRGQDLLDLYGRQLELYRGALSVLFGKPIQEAGIFSFYLGEYLILQEETRP